MRTALRLIGILLIFFVAFLAAFAFLFFLNSTGIVNLFGQPSYRNTATVVLQSVQQMSVLTTTRYNYSSMVTSEREMPPLLAGLYGERLVLVAVGHVTAGIDLSQLTNEDITLENGILTLTLPSPTLQDCFLNESASYVAQRDTGLFNRAAPNLDTEARRFAVLQFRDSALEANILAEVTTQAQASLGQFLQALPMDDVSQIVIQVAPADPNVPAVLPLTCQ